MDFFYRRKPWYAGQFVRKVVPKFEVNENVVPFFSTLLNRLKPVLLPVLVRNVDTTFLNTNILLPVTTNGEIDFDFMETFILELEKERIHKLEAYLKTSGLFDYNLTEEEKESLKLFGSTLWREFNVFDIFNVRNTHNILSSEVEPNSGPFPYLCASAENNGVDCYVSHDETLLEKGNCIFIGGKTFVVSYQEKDFFSNDSHNLALYVKERMPRKFDSLFLASCLKKGLGHKYTWGNSISKSKIKNDKILLPVTTNGEIDFDFMELFIRAVQKTVIKNVVLFTDEKIKATKRIVNTL